MGESVPGAVAELDFGRLGFIQDQETGRRSAVWALIVALAYSRHSFVWPTYSQKLEEVITGLEAAWAFFSGIPKYLVIDNFPAAVAGADSLHPRLTRGFLEYSQHRGFITDPAQATVRALLVVGAATLAPLRSYMTWVMSVCRTRVPLAEVIVTHQNQDTR